MAVANADLATLNAAVIASNAALDALLAAIAAGEELVWTPIAGTVIAAEAVGTASSDGEVKGDFELNWPVNSAEDVASVTINAVAFGIIRVREGEAVAFTNAGTIDEVAFFDGSALIQTDSAATGAIVVTYTAGGEPSTQGPRRILMEDITTNFVTSKGNNAQAKANMFGLQAPGIWSSVDGA